MNRLAEETSPYLLQHANNPVHWYAWGPDAFARAKLEDKPILLSVGYSACHWCHVMAHESFEDDATAAVMNALFVNVKVDREERPDVDAIYMDAVQAMTSHGGWPMTVFLTPDGRPFYGGTYFPRAQFTELMRRVSAAWRDERAGLLEQGDKLTAALSRFAELQPGTDVPKIDGAIDTLSNQFDPEWGGFGSAPKFPQTMSLELLLRRNPASEIVATSLDAMASGGMYDHLGGGFARYSVDREWLVPHFEKMLYDEALLARIYLHAWQATGAKRWRQVSDETIDYVLRDLRHPDGGFFSAEDADSEGVEGKFYVWSLDQVSEIGNAAAVEWYGVTAGGNFEGSNILNRPVRADLVRPPEVEQARQALFEAREERIRPGLDDKVLTEWNGLMISTLAEAGCLEEAQTAADFLLRELRRGDGRWLRSWKDGRAQHLAYAVDYAALIDAFTRLAEATGEARWIDEAVRTADSMHELFWDGRNDGLFTTGSDAEALIARTKDLFDNASPSANSLAAVGLARLAELTGRADLGDRALAIVRLLAEIATQHPSGFANLLGAADLLADGMTEIVIAGDRPDLVEVIHDSYLPNAVLAWGERYESPLWEGRDEASAYVCKNYACQLPATDVTTLRSQLDLGD